MMFPTPIDHQKNFEDNVGTLFQAIGSGYELSSHRIGSEMILRAAPPENSNLLPIDPAQEVFQELLNKGLVEKREDDSTNMDIKYHLTEQGQKLYAELSTLPFNKGLEIFVSRIRPLLK